MSWKVDERYLACTGVVIRDVIFHMAQSCQKKCYTREFVLQDYIYVAYGNHYDFTSSLFPVPPRNLAALSTNQAALA